jgi:methylenetetrahydrofolate--tRNA-(uracil-5-)-methyltransferase
VEAPRVLAPDLSVRARPHLFLAGQITGVEGYVESTACGHLAARAILDRLAGRPFRPPPAATAIGALHRHLTGEAHPPGYDYQPTNVVFALFPPLAGRHRGKAARKEAYAERARKELARWLDPEPQRSSA